MPPGPTIWPRACRGDLCEVSISAETGPGLTNSSGTGEANRQAAEAERALRPIAEQIRRERQAQLAEPPNAGYGPERLLVGLNVGLVPSVKQKGIMEGKVWVVASEIEDIGHERKRLSRRLYYGDIRR